MPPSRAQTATRWALAAGLLAALLVLSAAPVSRHLQAVGLLLGIAGVADPTGLVDLADRPVRENAARIVAADRPLRARAYHPIDTPHAPGIVLLHGVHPRGIGEPHLRAFARKLAATGLHVLTPELPELLDYRVEPSTIRDVAACAEHHAETTGGKVGVWGISFAGGLALLAASRPEGGAWFDHVVAIGAHHDLARLVRYYAGAEVRAPDGSPSAVRANLYGARVILFAHASSVFPPDGLAGARQALRLHLAGRVKAARQVAASLPPSTRERLEMLFDDRRADEIGKLLLRSAAEHAAELAHVSPAGQLDTLRVPTFLVHGTNDPVIPSLETEHLLREVPPSALRRALVTPVLRHTEATERPPWREYVRIVRFIAALLDEAHDG